jgi:hypothetical protein
MSVANAAATAAAQLAAAAAFNQATQHHLSHSMPQFAVGNGCSAGGPMAASNAQVAMAAMQFSAFPAHLSNSIQRSFMITANNNGGNY